MGRIVLCRPMFLSGSSKVPKTWICNLSTNHYTDGVPVFEELDYRKTEYMKCCCKDCVLGDSDEYRIGKPVSINKSYPQDVLIERGYVGIYKRRKK